VVGSAKTTSSLDNPPFGSQKLTDHDLFLKLFVQDRDRIFAYVRGLLPNHADAEDVFQRCSLLLWHKFTEFDTDRPFISWACGIAYYEVRNFIRVASRDRLYFDAELLDSLSETRAKSLASSNGRLESLHSCFEKLKSSDREMLQVVYEGLQTVAEFAVTQGKSLQTIYNRLSQVRRQLMDCISQFENTAKAKDA
jgi:RNA polymerase sigma-70 factor